MEEISREEKAKKRRKKNNLVRKKEKMGRNNASTPKFLSLPMRVITALRCKHFSCNYRVIPFSQLTSSRLFMDRATFFWLYVIRYLVEIYRIVFLRLFPFSFIAYHVFLSPLPSERLRKIRIDWLISRAEISNCTGSHFVNLISDRVPTSFPPEHLIPHSPRVDIYNFLWKKGKPRYYSQLPVGRRGEMRGRHSREEVTQFPGSIIRAEIDVAQCLRAKTHFLRGYGREITALGILVTVVIYAQ